MLLRLKNTYLFFGVLSPIMNPVFSVNPTQTENENASDKLRKEIKKLKEEAQIYQMKILKKT